MSPLDAGIAFNGGCGRCGKADGIRDLEIDVPQEWAMAYCRGCAADLARAFGLLSPAKRLASRA
jgi:hypothetical protein